MAMPSPHPCHSLTLTSEHQTQAHSTPQHTALFSRRSPDFRAFLSKKPPAAAMERQQQEEEVARRTLPRRGQIKAGIFASLFRCFVPRAPTRKEEGVKNKEGSSRRRVGPSG
ncbi:hypothetical protein BAE44_0016903 [Dichanthelium oligosanthes]|uniref:Uncharacterized protein n=1 Tax=Dichanthelium oligosanthes TaxID=888268 RepID=A0A1E5VAH9_9POAL|nr:hypothetical protein BAE44_0016903 [Dichanthelium oligosanthes]